jgi:hypothetical protein
MHSVGFASETDGGTNGAHNDLTAEIVMSFQQSNPSIRLLLVSYTAPIGKLGGTV